jgi:hypothetical protein
MSAKHVLMNIYKIISSHHIEQIKFAEKHHKQVVLSSLITFSTSHFSTAFNVSYKLIELH